MDVNYRSTSGCFLFPYESGRACHPERRRREGSAFPQMRRTCLREGSGGGIVFIGLFGILFVVGAALGIVAFTRLGEVACNNTPTRVQKRIWSSRGICERSHIRLVR